MKTTIKLFVFVLLGFFTLLTPTDVFGQDPQDVITESSEIEETEVDPDKPLDDIVEKRNFQDKRLMPYDPVREADIMWEKRVWRVIETKKIKSLFSLS